MGTYSVRRKHLRLSVWFAAVFLTAAAWGADTALIRAAIGPGAYAYLKNGTSLFLEVRPPAVGAEDFLKQFLNEGANWRQYTGLRAVPVDFHHLNAETQRQVLLTVFARDVVDDQGWLHVIQGDSPESLQALCRWLTGDPEGHRRVALPSTEALTAGRHVRIPRELLQPHLQTPTPDRAVQPESATAPVVVAMAVPQSPPQAAPPPVPAASTPAPKAEPPAPATPSPAPVAEARATAQPVLVPAKHKAIANEPVPVRSAALADRTARSRRGVHTDEPVHETVAAAIAQPVQVTVDEAEEVKVSPSTKETNGDDQFDWARHAGDLQYGQDAEGPYALYRLKEGEALYTAVVVRFTNLETHEVISKACERVQARSGITDPRDLKVGTPVKIPLDMLAPQYMPKGTPEREHYEDVLQTAANLRQTRVTTRDLRGVVVILDAGHGGRDHGASASEYGLYEDELNYDIMCRVKRILEQQTQAKVHVTIQDRSQGYEPTSASRFQHDTDEYLLTNPPYDNTDAKVSANLRWYLANSIFRRERAAGVDERKIIFTSFHCDKLYNGRLRGAMVYIPGARLRKAEEGHSGAEYSRYAEVQEARYVRTTSAEHRRDEALSRNFAVVLLDELGKHRIQRHKESDPIRAQIRQNGGVEYVPAVLRGNLVPTKVLIEVANLSNPTDCERLADPAWRQQFAEAYVAALKAFYNGS